MLILQDCAKKFGIDVHKIQRLFDTPETEQDFRENIKRTAELGIKASPTILINNHLFSTNQLLRAEELLVSNFHRNIFHFMHLFRYKTVS